jgi:hypothetical protein
MGLVYGREELIVNGRVNRDRCRRRVSSAAKQVANSAVIAALARYRGCRVNLVARCVVVNERRCAVLVVPKVIMDDRSQCNEADPEHEDRGNDTP